MNVNSIGPSLGQAPAPESIADGGQNFAVLIGNPDAPAALRTETPINASNTAFAPLPSSDATETPTARPAVTMSQLLATAAPAPASALASTYATPTRAAGVSSRGNDTAEQPAVQRAHANAGGPAFDTAAPFVTHPEAMPTTGKAIDSATPGSATDALPGPAGRTLPSKAVTPADDQPTRSGQAMPEDAQAGAEGNTQTAAGQPSRLVPIANAMSRETPEPGSVGSDGASAPAGAGPASLLKLAPVASQSVGAPVTAMRTDAYAGFQATARTEIASPRSPAIAATGDGTIAVLGASPAPTGAAVGDSITVKTATPDVAQGDPLQANATARDANSVQTNLKATQDASPNHTGPAAAQDASRVPTNPTTADTQAVVAKDTRGTEPMAVSDQLAAIVRQGQSTAIRNDTPLVDKPEARRSAKDGDILRGDTDAKTAKLPGDDAPCEGSLPAALADASLATTLPQVAIQAAAQMAVPHVPTKIASGGITTAAAPLAASKTVSAIQGGKTPDQGSKVDSADAGSMRPVVSDVIPTNGDATPPAMPSTRTAQHEAPATFGNMLAAADQRSSGTSAGPAPVAVADPATAAASAETQINARAGELGRSLGLEIARKVGAGEDSLRVRLNPAEFGRVEVTLAFDDKGSMQATVRAESHHALHLLQQDAPDLGRALDQAGIRTDAQSFRFESSNSGNGSGDARSFGQQQSRSGQQNFHEEPETPAPAYRALRGDGQVDLLA